MSGKRKYYPNNWKIIKNAPDVIFEPMDAIDVMDKDWSLRPGTFGVIRAESMRTGKVTEFSYQGQVALHSKLQKIIDTHRITIVTDDVIGTINYDIHTDDD